MSNQLNNISAAIAVPPVLGSKINTVTSDEGPTYPPAAPPTTLADEPQDAVDAHKLTSKPSETSLLDKPVPESSPKTKKEIIRKALKDLWTFLKTPLGFIVGIYGFLVVVWGAALVIILAGWTPMTKNTQDIWVEICSQVLNGLFTITGIGLIPWRVRDAWHMSVITRYRRKIIKLAKRHRKAGHEPRPVYPESSLDLSYLDEKERRRLARSEGKFMESQPWYNPQETEAHRIFPFGLALAITCLVVANSVFQCFLCGVMWGLNRHTRPAWTTALLIVMSFGCGIGAAVLIWWGGKKTLKRKEDDVV